MDELSRVQGEDHDEQGGSEFWATTCRDLHRGKAQKKSFTQKDGRWWC